MVDWARQLAQPAGNRVPPRLGGCCWLEQASSLPRAQERLRHCIAHSMVTCCICCCHGHVLHCLNCYMCCCMCDWHLLTLCMCCCCIGSCLHLHWTLFALASDHVCTCIGTCLHLCGSCLHVYLHALWLHMRQMCRGIYVCMCIHICVYE